MFEIIFVLMFLLVGGMFVYVIVKGIAEWSNNNNSPRLTVPALIVAKRVKVHHHHMETGVHTHRKYYVTFEVESGDRMELSLPGGEYGLLAEGDRGQLSFQGTRYLGFERGK